MPTFYNFRENGLDYSFDDIFVPVDLFRDGNLWIWGNGTNGKLGNGVTTGSISTPVTTFAGGTNWKQVSSGGNHTAAVKTDGTLWAWGRNADGQLGNATITSTSTPVTTFAGGTNWKQVTCGGYHTAAIKTDGTLWNWGRNTSGQLGRYQDLSSALTPVTTFAGGNNWADTATTDPAELYTLSCGSFHTAAIKTDGTLWTWGSNGFGQIGDNTSGNVTTTPVTTFAGGTNWKQVAGGRDHTAAIKTDGTLWTWGRNQYGQLGTNNTTTRSTPVTTFAGGTNWKQVACASIFRHTYTAAIKTDGTLWTWGRNTSGQLGDNTTTQRLTPVTTFAGGTNWKQVACGGEYIAAIKTDGTLWTWGRNNNGQLGTNDLTNRSTPVTTFAGGTNWKQVAGGRDHTAAIKTDGTLWTWGNNTNGQIGDNTQYFNRLTPVTTFAGGTNWKQVAGGYKHIAAVKTDGTLWTWGGNSNGQIGDNTQIFDLSQPLTLRLTPVTTFAGGTNWKQVAGGDGHTAALNDDGVNKRLYLWGSDSGAQLGFFYLNQDVIPNQTFAGGTNWKQVSSGGSHTAAVKTDGTLWAWGVNTFGQIGDNTSGNVRTTPVTTFAGGTNWKQVSSGDSYIAAIKTDGTLWTWGRNAYGQLGNGVTTDRSIPVTTTAGGTNWKQVACGNSHTAAIKTDGTLWTWGNGANGALGNGVTTGNISTPVTTFSGGTNWKQVSAGGSHTPAIKTDGTLWTWGNGGSGILGNGATTGAISTPVTTFAGGTNWKQVSSGGSHTAASTFDDPVL